MPKPTSTVHIALNAPPGTGKEGEEARMSLSAVVRVGRHLFLGSDETATLERVTDLGGGRFGEHRTYPLAELLDLCGGPDGEVDIEGFAWDPPYLWIAGSHGRKRGKIKRGVSDEEGAKSLAKVKIEENRYVLARIPLQEDAEQGGLVPRRSCPDPHDPARTLTAARVKGRGHRSALMRALRYDEHVGAYMKLPGKDNGFDIEGLEVRDGRVYLGLRGPVLRGWAVALELLPQEARREGRLRLAPVEDDGTPYRKHFLDLDGLGIRELAADGDDMLVLAGPTMGVRAPAAVFRWTGGLTTDRPRVVRGAELERIAELPHDVEGGADHPEGMCRFDVEGSDHCVLVLYDSAAPHRRDSSGVLGDVFTLPRPHGLRAMASRLFSHDDPGGTGVDA
ncbi:DUF3616 domain-containing protein [Longimicrobium terrae]|uniref:DUF3616 domain-containing protein n=1 Tax=Longimicrobium terrae TaxID=1639882 RepID=A0A841GZV0_9BACT|nr:DUF3616 domain-containing protein [Longimicrobium terrae]MBB4636724.1 hypothetical protein [Longimicrobium terrae]MBB6071277.1 hypothetical protein [Longimicrobium terrae]NNC29323.1 DUF3616 domain-containing protein [Longimicrobium terrae]